MTCSCINVWRTLFHGLLSHLGTLIIIIIYIVGGGYLFVLLESPNEIRSCFNSYNLFAEKLNDTTMRGMTIGIAGYNTSVYYDELYTMLFNFSKDVYRLGISPLKDCTTLGQPDNLLSWNLANSIFFCATIITTIGYGNIYPVTMWGRIVCVIYGFIGIPLMLLFLGNFGDLLAGVFRYIYLNMCCFRCGRKNNLKNNSRSDDDIFQNDIENNDLEILQEESNMPMKSLGPAKMTINKDIILQNQENNEEENDQINIPLTFVTGFLILYMYLGAILFQIWEAWDLVAAVYYSFITVSTVGFGDLYPAKETIGTNAALLELLVAAAYLVIGLAVLSMCFNLIKDELMDKFLWLGTKIGLIDSNESSSTDIENDNRYDNVLYVESESIQETKSTSHLNEAYVDFNKHPNSKLKSN